MNPERRYLALEVRLFGPELPLEEINRRLRGAFGDVLELEGDIEVEIVEQSVAGQE